MSDMSPMFKTAEYEVADSPAEVQRLIEEEGFEPYGEPTFLPDFDTEDYGFRQAMVKKAPLDIEEYVRILKSLMVVATNISNMDMESQFEPEEWEKINSLFG